MQEAGGVSGDPAPGPEQQTLVAKAMAELAATGHLGDETFSRIARLVDEASEEELKALLELLGRATPALAPPGAGAG